MYAPYLESSIRPRQGWRDRESEWWGMEVKRGRAIKWLLQIIYNYLYNYGSVLLTAVCHNRKGSTRGWGKTMRLMQWRKRKRERVGTYLKNPQIDVQRSLWDRGQNMCCWTVHALKNNHNVCSHLIILSILVPVYKCSCRASSLPTWATWVTFTPICATLRFWGQFCILRTTLAHPLSCQQPLPLLRLLRPQ